MRTVKIPTAWDPFVVTVNNARYVYQPGTEVTVPDEVAAVINSVNQAQPEHQTESGKTGDVWTKAENGAEWKEPEGGSGGAEAVYFEGSVAWDEDAEKWRVTPGDVPDGAENWWEFLKTAVENGKIVKARLTEVSGAAEYLYVLDVNSNKFSDDTTLKQGITFGGLEDEDTTVTLFIVREGISVSYNFEKYDPAGGIRKVVYTGIPSEDFATATLYDEDDKEVTANDVIDTIADGQIVEAIVSVQGINIVMDVLMYGDSNVQFRGFAQNPMTDVWCLIVASMYGSSSALTITWIPLGGA